MNTPLLTPDEIFDLMKCGVIRGIQIAPYKDGEHWMAYDRAGVAINNDWALSQGATPEEAATKLYKLIVTARLQGEPSPASFKQAEHNVR